MIKSKKRFTLTTDAVNSYGFRVKTSGIDLTQFKRNPVMLWMHGRAISGDRNQILPLGSWDDLEHTTNSITGVPVFDDTDSFALSIYNKVENGTIKMASAGLNPLAWDGNPFTSTCTRSIMQEASIVDIGANDEALAVTLYNKNGDIIQLSTVAGFSDPLVLQLAAKSWRELDRSGEMGKLKAAAPDLYALKFNEEFGHYPDGYKAIANVSAGNSVHSPYVLRLFAKSYHELHHSDGLLQLKQLAPDLYRTKFFEQYGKFPEGMELPTNINLSSASIPMLDLSQILELDAKSWNDLEWSNQLVTLKQVAPDLFKAKYLKQFGKPYTNNK